MKRQLKFPLLAMVGEGLLCRLSFDIISFALLKAGLEDRCI